MYSSDARPSRPWYRANAQALLTQPEYYRTPSLLPISNTCHVMYAFCTLHHAFILMQSTQGPFFPDFLRKLASHKSDIRYFPPKPNKGLKGKGRGPCSMTSSAGGGTCNFSPIPFPPHLHIPPRFSHVRKKTRRCGRGCEKKDKTKKC